MFKQNFNYRLRPEFNYRFLMFFVMLYMVTLAASILLTYRLTNIHGVALSTSIAIYPMSYFCGDIIAEVYGYKVARQVVWYGIVCMFLFALLAKLPLLIHSNAPQADTMYQHIIDPFLRIAWAGMISGIVGDFMNIYALTKWKVLLKGRYFWLRSLGSTGIGEFLNTTIAYCVLFVGVLPVPKLVEIILVTYLIKLVYSVIAVPVCTVVVYFLKRYEQSDVLDTDTNFNPLSLSINEHLKR